MKTTVNRRAYSNFPELKNDLNLRTAEKLATATGMLELVEFVRTGRVIVRLIDGGQVFSGTPAEAIHFLHGFIAAQRLS